MRFLHDDIVYYLEQTGPAQYDIRFGIVDEEFSDRVVVDALETKERRLIDGVPIDEFLERQDLEGRRWKKLPKGWTYSMNLYELTFEDLPEDYYALDLRRREDVYTAYKAGLIVKSCTIDHGVPHSVITKEGYRIELSCYQLHRRPDTIGLYKWDVFETWEAAALRKSQIMSEFERQAALSDKEWSIEQIEKDLNKYQLSVGATDEQISQCREYLLALPNIEDVVTRVFSGFLQWKYDKGKKWISIDLKDE